MSLPAIATGLTGGALTALYPFVAGFGLIPTIHGTTCVLADTITNNGKKGIPLGQDKELDYQPDTGFSGMLIRSWAAFGIPSMGYALFS